jgi:hypothetical protein
MGKFRQQVVGKVFHVEQFRGVGGEFGRRGRWGLVLTSGANETIGRGA